MEYSSNLLHASVIPHTFSWNMGLIHAAFATRFDPKEGNVIEYIYPETIDKTQLDGLEFLTLPSGSHNVEQDYIIFRCSDLWGVSVFNQVLDQKTGFLLFTLFQVHLIHHSSRSKDGSLRLSHFIAV